MRKLMVAVAAVAGLALTAGCKKEPQEERRELAEAQRDAQKDIANARQDANEERADLQKDFNKERADLQKDEAEIQKDENEEIADAQRNVAEEERDVYEAEMNRSRDLAKDTAGSTAAVANVSVQGRVRSTLGDSLVIVVPNKANAELKLKTDDNTRVTQNNVAVDLDDFKEGTEVRASYVSDGDDLVARDVVIITPVKK
ncbi:hypothetical protein [Hyalangium minutum]|uniref:TolA protein n=1 Tax=Hyalangium minutum TaxID=394096 RepID=A0A085WG38_9BACT|nr:hypothetical protein [Hyalangium minutum]KFE66651.1 TolA protein [Hyalangium minutum]